MAEQFRQDYGAGGKTAEDFLQRLVARHPEHPERALSTERRRELLAGAPAVVAVAVVAAAVDYNLCSPAFVRLQLQQHLGQSPAAAPPPPPLPAVQLTLPALDVERPLAAYGRALDPQP